MARIEFKNDSTRALEESEGNGGRLNVSARSADRVYYKSRTDGQAYGAMFHHTVAETGDFSVYIKNTSTSKTLVVHKIEMGSSVGVSVGLDFVTGTAAAGSIADVPVNLNAASPNDADCVFMKGAAVVNGITGLTATGHIDMTWFGAYGNARFEVGGAVRLGQGDAMALRIAATEASAVASFGGSILFYYE